MKEQDKYIEMVNQRDAQYRKDKNIQTYIEFWEKLWADNGLVFEGMKWMFMLPDLYIKEKRYLEALEFVRYIKETKNENYGVKADKYIEKLNGKIEKQNSNR